MNPNNIDYNNKEAKKAMSKEYYDEWLKPYMGFDYTKVSKENAKEYRENIKKEYKNNGIDNNNDYEKMMEPYINQMNELTKDIPKDNKNNI